MNKICKITTVMIFLSVYSYCPLVNKKASGSKVENVGLVFYYALEDIEIFDKPEGKLMGVIETGDSFFLAFNSYSSKYENWNAIRFQFHDSRTIYYIKKSNKYSENLLSSYIKKGMIFQVPSPKGANLCRKPFKDMISHWHNERCDEPFYKIPYRTYLTVIKAYYMNTGIWFKVDIAGNSGYVHESRVIPSHLYHPKSVDAFIEEVKKICNVQEDHGRRDLECLSTKTFPNGDAGEKWIERAKFSIDLYENSLFYGIKYIETRGFITKVDMLKDNKYRMYVINEIASSFGEPRAVTYIEILLDKNKHCLYGPRPEALMESYLDPPNELIKFTSE